MKQKKQKTDGYLRIFTSYYRPHWKLFTLDVVCALCTRLVDLTFPIISRFSMQTLLPGQMFMAFFMVMTVLTRAYVFKGCFYYIITCQGHLLGVRMKTDIWRDLFSHIQDLPFSFYDKNHTGQPMSRVTGDLFEITKLAHHDPEDLFVSSITILGAFYVILTTRWELALIAFAVIPLFILFTTLYRKRTIRASTEVKAKLAGIGREIEPPISGTRTAKVFANEAVGSAKFDQANDQFRGAKWSYYWAMALYQLGMEFFMGVLSVVVIAFGGFLLTQGRMGLIDLTTFFLYISTFITPIHRLFTFVEQFMQDMAGFKRSVALMRMEPDIQDEPDAQGPTDVEGDIRAEDVTFRYGPSDLPMLEHVALYIRPGETMAMAGPSDGGKSTLCQLIPRFYDVAESRVLVGGEDMHAPTQHSLRASIGIVQQDVFLSVGTICDNIRYGRPDATEAEVVEAAKRAEIYGGVLDMPDGFQTRVGERGAMLSGGQKQRVSIARIFLENPPVLILDEATSALDSVAEARIQSIFDELTKDRTALIIVHCLSTIRSASRILVIDGNDVQEEETHEELTTKGREYVQLYLVQKSVSV